MRHFSIYDVTTGLFTGVTHSTTNFNDEWLSIITPLGFGAIEGAYNPRTQRVDLKTLEVVSHSTECPGDDYEWAGDERGWELSVDAQRRADVKHEALRKIVELEQKQLRPMRELLVDPSNQAAADIVHQIEEDIKRLRRDL